MGVQKKKTAKTRRKAGSFKVKTKLDKKKPKEKIKLPSRKAQAIWDYDKTLIENYQALGLAYDSNSTVQRLHEKLVEEDPEKEWSLSDEVADDIEGKNQLKDLLEVPDAAAPKGPRLGIRERHYYKRLHEKHGENVDAMVRDVKLNYNQYTKKQIKKKLGIYMQMYKDKLVGANKT